ncbi:MAG: Holliday junction resolvase RuvX [Proteobacteria bacterium]|nr:Holliday junction resolvase RuvX [Pseudomonadota bacterium]
MAKGVFFAIDWGEKRIGLAVGQALTNSARGLAVLPAKKGIPDWALVKRWLSKYNPEGVILGLPLLLDGKEQPLTERVRLFADAFLSQIDLPLYWVEEQLSSSEASERCDNPAMLDAEAAAVILETWLAMPERQRDASRHQTQPIIKES